jgi:hypothetical protein
MAAHSHKAATAFPFFLSSTLNRNTVLSNLEHWLRNSANRILLFAACTVRAIPVVSIILRALALTLVVNGCVDLANMLNNAKRCFFVIRNPYNLPYYAKNDNNRRKKLTYMPTRIKKVFLFVHDLTISQRSRSTILY